MLDHIFINVSIFSRNLWSCISPLATFFNWSETCVNSGGWKFMDIWFIIHPNKYDGIVTYPPLRKQGFGGSVYLPRFLQVEWCKTAIWQSQMTQATNQLQAWSIGNPRHLTLPSFKFKHSTLSSRVHPGNADWIFSMPVHKNKNSHPQTSFKPNSNPRPTESIRLGTDWLNV